MGKGIIDYLGRYYLGARITSDGGELVLSLRTGSCQVGRPWLSSQGTGHTVGTPCQYVMNIGAMLHNFKM